MHADPRTLTEDRAESGRQARLGDPHTLEVEKADAAVEESTSMSPSISAAALEGSRCISDAALEGSRSSQLEQTGEKQTSQRKNCVVIFITGSYVTLSI